jgi:hypothetical protein
MEEKMIFCTKDSWGLNIEPNAHIEKFPDHQSAAEYLLEDLKAVAGVGPDGFKSAKIEPGRFSKFWFTIPTPADLDPADLDPFPADQLLIIPKEENPSGTMAWVTPLPPVLVVSHSVPDKHKLGYE